MYYIFVILPFIFKLHKTMYVYCTYIYICIIIARFSHCLFNDQCAIFEYEFISLLLAQLKLMDRTDYRSTSIIVPVCVFFLICLVYFKRVMSCWYAMKNIIHIPPCHFYHVLINYLLPCIVVLFWSIESICLITYKRHKTRNFWCNFLQQPLAKTNQMLS